MSASKAKPAITAERTRPRRNSAAAFQGGGCSLTSASPAHLGQLLAQRGVVGEVDHERHDRRHEIIQETFLRAWRGIGGFKGEAQFFTWLYRIGVNEANRRLKRTANAATQRSLEDLTQGPRDPAPGPEGQSEQRDLQTALEAAVRDLHPDYRTPLILRDIEGLSTDEAAAIMGLHPA
ncbi:MAG: sigma-70 family RNA polymerase sigma factor, partial [Thermoleophilaceae bacterium]|nr:sigma-70 family RNA polymerase sigma factor [Thermoleophilaceae bacterium]